VSDPTIKIRADISRAVAALAGVAGVRGAEAGASFREAIIGDALSALPFVQAKAQELAERERRIYEYQALGVTRDQVDAFERSAYEYAATTMQPNHEVVEGAHLLALEALKRGEPMPTDVMRVFQAAHVRYLLSLIGGGTR
jgi:hypothetical protein